MAKCDSMMDAGVYDECDSVMPGEPYPRLEKNGAYNL